MGPLTGIRIIEMAAIGPVPLAGMLLSDLGADIIRIDRTKGGSSLGDNPADITGRGRRSIAIDLKQRAGVEAVLRLVEWADVLLEGFRPGVMEKNGLGPDVCLGRNPRLIYGRMTGWGQEGPLAHAAGHDINYIAITGALAAIGRRQGGPVPPLNLLGDYGGGTMYLLVGVLSALVERNASGKGQVIDAAITDGVVSLLAFHLVQQALGTWSPERQNNMLDGGAHYYDTYECADGRWISVGSIEPQFYTLLLEKLGIPMDEAGLDAHFAPARWPALKERIAAVFRTRTCAQWCELMEGTDVCFAPVLSMDEAPDHPHNRARGSFVARDGVVQPAPAPRFSRTPGDIQGPPVAVAQHTDEILAMLGFDAAAIARLRADGAVK
jgi:alpha-methylacyl-CoA racemase